MSKSQSLYELLKGQERNENPLDTGLSLEKWRELGKNGVSIPMKIQLHGSSMRPLIRPEKDTVTIMPLVRDPMIGDIVLFRRSDGKNIAHRVCKIFPGGIQTWGDNCLFPDAPKKLEDVFGLIVSIERSGKTYQLDTNLQRAHGIRWLKYGRPIWTVPQKVKLIGGIIIRKIYPGFHKVQNDIQE